MFAPLRLIGLVSINDLPYYVSERLIQTPNDLPYYVSERLIQTPNSFCLPCMHREYDVVTDFVRSASFILHFSLRQDDKIKSILSAASVTVESYWPGLFAKALDGVDIKEMVSNIGSGAGAAGAAAPAAAAGGAAGGAEEGKIRLQQPYDRRAVWFVMAGCTLY